MAVNSSVQYITYDGCLLAIHHGAPTSSRLQEGRRDVQLWDLEANRLVADQLWLQTRLLAVVFLPVVLHHFAVRSGSTIPIFLQMYRSENGIAPD